MGAGNSSQGKVYQGRLVDQSQNGKGFGQATSSAPADSKIKMPEVSIRTITWTRESHGLFDFEVKESERKLYEKKQFKMKGSHRVYRAESEVSTELLMTQNFEDGEKDMDLGAKDRIIARMLHQNGTYWVFNKNYVDESIEQVLEKKPEEKIWRVVRDTRCPEMDMPCYRLQKKDLIKVGRVRFKIRDIMSPVYREIENGVDIRHDHHREMFPSMLGASISSSIIQDDQQSSSSEEDSDNPQNQLQLNQDDAHAIAEAHQNALVTESDQDEDEEEQVLEHANTIVNADNMGRNGMNADPLLSEENDPANATQFETGKPLQGSLLKDDVKVTSSKKQLDAVESASQVGGSELPVCRICLMEDNEVDNPLFTPCKCAGSMRFIHHLCLKTWFANKRIMKVSNIVTTYFWKNLECELCKTAYPYETRSLDGKEMLNIIEYDTPQPSFDEHTQQTLEAYYIVLESISSNTSKVIHVVNMQDTLQLYIGRGHDAHVRVTDISVSRLHATLVKSAQGYYFLTDNDSKFGTLSLVKTPLELPQGSTTTLQIGRSILDIEVKNISNFALGGCLCFGNKPKKQIGQEENLVSMDGNVYFPQQFTSQAFLDLMDKRRLAGQRNSIRMKKKLGSTKSNSLAQTANSNGKQGQTQPIGAPMTDLNERENQFGQESQQSRQQNQFVVQGSNNGRVGQAIMRSAEDDDLEYGDEEDEEEESEEFEGQQQVIMDRGQQNRGDPRRAASNNNDQAQDSQNNNRQRQIEAEEEAQLALAIQQSLQLAQQEEERRSSMGRAQSSLSAQPNAMKAEEKKMEQSQSQAALDAEIDQLDKELTPAAAVDEDSQTERIERTPAKNLNSSNQTQRAQAHVPANLEETKGNNEVRLGLQVNHNTSMHTEEESKSPDNKKMQSVTQMGKVNEEISNISTQRASQVQNRFSNQMSGKIDDEIKEAIDNVPHSPISQHDPIMQTHEVIGEINPGPIDLSATQIGSTLNYMSTPATQLVASSKALNLKGKKTERVADVVSSSINDLNNRADDTNTNTQRQNIEEVKNGLIPEEPHGESDAEHAATDSFQQTIGQPDKAEEGDPEVDLPAHGTEVHHPEMGSGAPQDNDNLNTIQQRDEGEEEAEVGSSSGGQPPATEENKNNEQMMLQ